MMKYLEYNTKILTLSLFYN